MGRRLLEEKHNFPNVARVTLDTLYLLVILNQKKIYIKKPFFSFLIKDLVSSLLTKNIIFYQYI